MITIVTDAVGKHLTWLNCCGNGGRNGQGANDRLAMSSSECHERSECGGQPCDVRGIDIQQRIVEVESFHLRRENIITTKLYIEHSQRMT